MKRRFTSNGKRPREAKRHQRNTPYRASNSNTDISLGQSAPFRWREAAATAPVRAIAMHARCVLSAARRMSRTISPAMSTRTHAMWLDARWRPRRSSGHAINANASRCASHTWKHTIGSSGCDCAVSQVPAMSSTLRPSCRTSRRWLCASSGRHPSSPARELRGVSWCRQCWGRGPHSRGKMPPSAIHLPDQTGSQAPTALDADFFDNIDPVETFRERYSQYPDCSLFQRPARNPRQNIRTRGFMARDLHTTPDRSQAPPSAKEYDLNDCQVGECWGLLPASSREL